MRIINTFLTRTLSLIVCVMLSSAAVFAQEHASLSDAEVAAIAVVANQIDIDYADIAKQKSKNKDILQFATTMARDHKAVIDQASALVKKLNVTPKDNAVSKQLVSDAEKAKAALNSKSGKAFDKAYIDNEVSYHKTVVNAVETLLIPETENLELKELLQNILPALKTHLAHAEKVQKEIN